VIPGKIYSDRYLKEIVLAQRHWSAFFLFSLEWGEHSIFAAYLYRAVTKKDK